MFRCVKLMLSAVQGLDLEPSKELRANSSTLEGAKELQSQFE